jgi:hypothetical protein
MSTRYNNSSHYENHERAAELQNGPAHANRVAEQQGKQNHLTGPEQTRKAQEHAQDSPQQTRETSTGHGSVAFGHNDIAALAYELWQARGCPDGSPEEDWYRAAETLRTRSYPR